LNVSENKGVSNASALRKKKGQNMAEKVKYLSNKPAVK
jgi:hypothetical protein